jgi:hypothetical protein
MSKACTVCKRGATSVAYVLYECPGWNQQTKVVVRSSPHDPMCHNTCGCQVGRDNVTLFYYSNVANNISFFGVPQVPLCRQRCVASRLAERALVRCLLECGRHQLPSVANTSLT